MDYKIIENRIMQYIDNDKKQFVIYPYGNNGVTIKHYLKDRFDISPVMIIDNKYCNYNEKIQNREYLRKNYNEQMVIILTIEDENLNNILIKELLEYVAAEQIINIVDCSVNKENDLSKFEIRSFLPNALIEKNNKIKNTEKSRFRVRVLSTGNGSAWNSLITICKAFQEDDQFELLIIIGGDEFERHKKIVEKDNFSSIGIKEYNAVQDKPDVLILNHHCMQAEILGICAECKLVIMASMQLIRYKKTLKDLWNLLQKNIGKFRPDYYLFDSLMFREIKESAYMSDKVIEMGNAKYDGIYEAMKKKTYGKEYSKLKNKKIILWATDHGIYDGIISYEQTFDLYAKNIFRYFAEHTELGLIFRPHPTFIDEMRKNGLWSKEEIRKLKIYFKESKNMVFDLSDTYNQAFSLADGIITDAYCGIICSALATQKPLCMTYRSVDLEPLHRELSECFYAAYSDDDIVRFIEMITREEDILLPLRKKAFDAYIKNFDGKNGYRIKEFIKAKLMADE